MSDQYDLLKVEPTNAGQDKTAPIVSNLRSEVNAGGSWGPIPQMTTGMTYREVGTAGLRAFGGWIREEFLPQLQGRQAARQFREMRDNSAIVGGVLFAIQSTMRKVQWRTLPNDENETDPESDQGVEILDSMREDMHTPWDDFISESLSMLPFGFAPHEIVYKKRLGRDPGPDPDRPGHDLPSSNYDDGLIGWNRLPLRGQDTIIKWFFDDNGIPKGMTQQPWIGPLVDIPMEKLLLFRPTYTKSNPEGYSILRTAYRAYYMQKRLEEQEAILTERMAGFPVVRVPMQLIQAANSGDSGAVASMAQFKKIATNIRIDEQMGLVLPSNVYDGMNGPSTIRQYDLEFVTPAGRAPPDIDKMIQRYQLNIMTSVMADFLSLGHSTRGTQSLANNKTDMFFQAIEGYLNSNASVLNEHGVARLWKLNGFDLDNMPRIKPDLATRVDMDVLSNVVLRFSQAGMPMFPNEELQTYLMEAAGMPDVIDPAALQFMQENHDAANAPKPDSGFGQDGKDKKGDTPLEKLIKVGLARRMNRYKLSKFNVSTAKADKPKKRHYHLNGKGHG